MSEYDQGTVYPISLFDFNQKTKTGRLAAACTLFQIQRLERGQTDPLDIID